MQEYPKSDSQDMITEYSWSYSLHTTYYLLPNLQETAEFGGDKDSSLSVRN